MQNMDLQVVESDVQGVESEHHRDAVRSKKGKRVEYYRADSRINPNFCRVQKQFWQRARSALKDLPLCACAMLCFKRVVCV